MSITLNLDPEIENGLIIQAQARGISLEGYIGEIVAREAKFASSGNVAASARDLVELFAPLRGLFQDGELDFKRNPSACRPVDLS
jgi:hypothetical protein